MKLRKLCALLLATGLLALSACSDPAAGTTNTPSPGTSDSPQQGGEATIRVALATASGGLGDRSFNDSAWLGFQKAAEELNVEIQVVEPQSVTDYGTTLTALADQGFDFIMAAGNDWVETINTVAPKYPEIMFGGVNIECTLDNVAVAKFSDFEGGFLAGALAGMMTQTDTIGYLGGVDAPAIQRFLVGYQEGAAYVNEDITVLPTFVGSFADPGKGKEFSLELYNQDADIIYHGAGKSGEGLFEALMEVPDNCYAIGCDSDQDYIVEGRVLASTIKHVDVAAYDFIKSVVDGTFTSGDHIYNIANGGIDLSPMTYTADIVPQEVKDTLEDIKEKIVSGEIVITDVFELQE